MHATTMAHDRQQQEQYQQEQEQQQHGEIPQSNLAKLNPAAPASSFLLGTSGDLDAAKTDGPTAPQADDDASSTLPTSSPSAEKKPAEADDRPNTETTAGQVSPNGLSPTAHETSTNASTKSFPAAAAATSINSGGTFVSPGRQDRPPPARFDRRPRVLLSLKYSAQEATLSVVVHKVKNLQETPHTTLRPSPYVKLYAIESCGPGFNRRLPNSKRKTRSQRSKVNPIFEETLTYFLPSSEVGRRRLELSVCSDRGFFGRNVVLGRCIVGLTGLLQGAEEVGPKDRSVSNGDPRAGAETTLTDWFVLWPTERDLRVQEEARLKKSATFAGSDRLSRMRQQHQSQEQVDRSASTANLQAPSSNLT